MKRTKEKEERKRGREEERKRGREEEKKRRRERKKVLVNEDGVRREEKGKEEGGHTLYQRDIQYSQPLRQLEYIMRNIKSEI